MCEYIKRIYKQEDNHWKIGLLRISSVLQESPAVAELSTDRYKLDVLSYT